MRLNGEPSNILMRGRVWSDDLPRWMNRLAHYTGLWLVGSALGCILMMVAKGQGFDYAMQRFAAPSLVATAMYGGGLLVASLGRFRARHPRPAA